MKKILLKTKLKFIKGKAAAVSYILNELVFSSFSFFLRNATTNSNLNIRRCLKKKCKTTLNKNKQMKKYVNICTTNKKRFKSFTFYLFVKNFIGYRTKFSIFTTELELN